VLAAVAQVNQRPEPWGGRRDENTVGWTNAKLESGGFELQNREDRVVR